MDGLKFNFKNSVLKANLDHLDDKLKAVLMMHLVTEAERLEAQMKLERPWTDRTGRAKAGLKATASEKGSRGGLIYRITLAHGVDYGIWLELANERNFAIINPTINRHGQEVIGRTKGLLNKLG